MIRTPDGGLQPQVAEANGRSHLVYLKGDPAESDVFYRSRPVGETNLSTAVRVNSNPGTAVAIGNVRGAQLAVGGGYLHVVWNGSAKSKTAQNPRGGLCYTRGLLKAGAVLEFEPQRDLMSQTFNLDGGASVAADEDGHVYVVWHAHQKGVAEEDESHRAVFVASSTNSGVSFTAERKVTDGTLGVCGCCGLKAYAPAAGRLAILYRAADSDAHRDMILMLSTNAGQSFKSRTVGKWKVSTCPMSTPWLGTSSEGTLYAAWETDGRVFWTKIDPANFGSEAPTYQAMNVGKLQQKHPRFAFSAKKGEPPLLTWVNGTGWEKGGTVGWDLIESSQSFPPIDGVRPWTFSAALPDADGGFTILY